MPDYVQLISPSPHPQPLTYKIMGHRENAHATEKRMMMFLGEMYLYDYTHHYV
jgi:hypothetical protein